MIALDTNVVVRLLVADDPDQTSRAARLVGGNPVWLSKTVLLEAEWVLRFCYERDAETINQAFRRLLGLPDVTAEDLPAVTLSLAWHAAGLDFADALHLASASSAKSFATFDKKLRKAASKLEGTPSTLEP